MTTPANFYTTKLVRTAVADTLNTSLIPGLAKVHRSQPYVDVWNNTGYDDGSIIAYVFIPDESEPRISMGGPYSGQKEVNFAIDLIMYFKDSDKDWELAQDHYDDIKDQIKWQIRGFGRTLQRPDVILQAGEWTPSIRHLQSEPQAIEGGKILIRGVISFEVTVVLTT